MCIAHTSPPFVSDGANQFMQDAAAGGFADRVAILVWSEISRRVTENASSGNDHGGYPSLTDLDDGNLRMSTGFRSVYATALSDWLRLATARK